MRSCSSIWAGDGGRRQDLRPFGRFGILVGGAYAVMQIGRTSFVVVVLRGQPRGGGN
jgi:hypothetical protein